MQQDAETARGQSPRLRNQRWRHGVGQGGHERHRGDRGELERHHEEKRKRQAVDGGRDGPEAAGERLLRKEGEERGKHRSVRLLLVLKEVLRQLHSEAGGLPEGARVCEVVPGVDSAGLSSQQDCGAGEERQRSDRGGRHQQRC